MKPATRKTANAESGRTSIRDRIDRFLTARSKFKGSATLCLVLLAFFLYLGVRIFSGHNEPAQLRFVENPVEPSFESVANGDRTTATVFTGEAHDTAQRLRECGSLLIAVSLSAFEEFRVHGKFPASLEELLTGIRKRSLLPPGIEIRDGGLYSSLSDLKLSYQPDPFSFEIIALPSDGGLGPAMIFRFPLPPSRANSIVYFESPGTNKQRQPIPDPFRTTEQLTAVGWTIRHWKGEALPLNDGAVRDLQEQAVWLKRLTKGER
jgi:hypothetical protein